VLVRHTEWMRQRGHSENTIYCRGRFLARLGAALAPVPVLEADAAMLAGWRAGLRISSEAIASYVCAARTFYSWSVAAGLRDDNPAALLPVPRVGRRLPRPIPETSLMAAVEAAPPRIRPWLVLAGWCGLRCCEIAYLQRSCILDEVTPPVLIVAAGATKGHAPERVIPMSAFVLAELAAADLPASGWAFPRRDGRKGPNRPFLISHLANKHLHEMGFSETLHQLRHRCLSELYKSTLDLRLVQDIAGHASPTTTSGYAAYAKPNAVRALGALAVPGRLRVIR
jgi:integrase/recombinase XerC